MLTEVNISNQRILIFNIDTLFLCQSVSILNLNAEGATELHRKKPPMTLGLHNQYPKAVWKNKKKKSHCTMLLWITVTWNTTLLKGHLHLPQSCSCWHNVFSVLLSPCSWIIPYLSQLLDVILCWRITCSFRYASRLFYLTIFLQHTITSGSHTAHPH